MKNEPPVYTLEMTECDYHRTTIRVWEQGISAPVVFSGDGYWQWGLGISARNNAEYRAKKPWIRAHGTCICWAEWLHDGGLEGWHTCVLHAGGTLAILPHHPDYEHVHRLMEFAGRPERDVLKEIA
jgi:hypothetical protein